MILDERTEMADATALSTAGTGLALVGDVIDLGAAANMGAVDGLYLVVQIDTAVTSGGAATVEFQLASDAQAAIAVDGSATVHYKSAAIAKASLVAGYQAVVIPMPLDVATGYERYVGILQNVGTAALTAGKINAFLTTDPKVWRAYANAANA